MHQTLTEKILSRATRKKVLAGEIVYPEPDLITVHDWYVTNFDMALKIKPLADRVLIEPMAAETKTASGIIIPDNAKEKPQKGKVVAVGNGTKDEKMTVSKGDTVLYGKYAGTELKLEGQDYLIMRESAILAIV